MHISVTLDTLSMLCLRVVSVLSPLSLFSRGGSHIEINPEVKPVIHPPRKVPFTLLPNLKHELERMEQLGAIEKVDQPTEWVNSIVIVEKPDGNLDPNLDPKDLNRAVKREHFQLPTATEITSKLTGAKVFSKLDAKDGFLHVKLDQFPSHNL